MNGIHEVTGSTPVWSTILSSSITSRRSLNVAHVPEGRIAGRGAVQFPADRLFGPYRNADER